MIPTAPAVRRRVDPTGALLPAVCLLAAACTPVPPPDGEWLGACNTDTFGVRVRLQIDEDAPAPAAGNGQTLARLPDRLDFLLQDMTRDGAALSLDGALGLWSSTCCAYEPVDISFDVTLLAGEPGDEMRGTCTWEGAEGDAALVRMSR